MTPSRRLSAAAFAAAGFAALASSAPRAGADEVAREVPPSPNDAGTAVAPASPSRGPGFDLLAAMASVTDRSRGSDADGLPSDTSAPSAPSAAADAWTWSVTPYLWLFDTDGSVNTKSGRTLPVSVHLHDSYELVKDHGDPSFAGHFEGTNGDFTFFLDGNFMHFSGDGGTSVTGPHGLVSVDASVDWDLKIQQYELGETYRIFEFHANAKRPAAVEVLAGARWNSLSVDADLDIDGKRISKDFEAHFRSSWVDPFVGARTRIPVCEQVDFTLRGDVGGGVGEGSQNCWNVITGIDWKVGESTSVFLGYRWYDVDRRSGSHDTSLQFEGPAAGVTIRF